MKVIFVNNSIVPYRHEFFRFLYKNYKENLKGSKVLYLTKNETIRDWVVDSDDIENFPTKVLPSLYQGRNKASTTSDFILNYGYFKDISEGDLLFTLGYSYTTYLFMALFARLKNKKTICFCEISYQDKKRGFIKERLKFFLLSRLYNHFAVPGQKAMDYLLSMGIKKDRITLVGNSAPFRYDCKNQRNKNETNKENINILFVGRLAEEKNILFALDSLENIKDIELNITLVGSGPLQLSVEERSINSKHKYTIVPFCDRELLPEIYCKNDILLLPSYSESWGLVVNEAIQFGLAILASENVGCTVELVKDNGKVFDPSLPFDFINKLNQIVKNLDEYKERSLDLHKINDVENNAKRIMKCLQKLKE
ncbi:glycosyltransferase family 4 protein [Yersinia enterocolitica]|uniref:glycosyltransferase family 4 protein n=1 Tax=Yersinia enterocolitica TaxID=630 RepID=UPI0021E945B1|nr:glycosyltransferase family 4 protein [Yersinia enterocolitica]EKN3338181.1 glycosyltransferase family 4 protein [Yersinia enterocolitica]EKN3568100.1 glycosyltransferase family 4 protein [Yersinia enterocolitica]EKN3780173.1 glycosyltransferase family 4 protein [Yersinia enterocolitica]EKN3880596.1 glycosyltransferase family 4 protein [Yersinia enterocolitica]EKN4009828.1 glycosyltransferase family 4 protein [Yersinia enterocolitica]